MEQTPHPYSHLAIWRIAVFHPFQQFLLFGSVRRFRWHSQICCSILLRSGLSFCSLSMFSFWQDSCVRGNTFLQRSSSLCLLILISRLLVSVVSGILNPLPVWLEDGGNCCRMTSAVVGSFHRSYKLLLFCQVLGCCLQLRVSLAFLDVWFNRRFCLWSYLLDHGIRMAWLTTSILWCISQVYFHHAGHIS